MTSFDIELSILSGTRIDKLCYVYVKKVVKLDFNESEKETLREREREREGVRKRVKGKLRG
jgi:hypothetical protein